MRRRLRRWADAAIGWLAITGGLGLWTAALLTLAELSPHHH
jgi:hypothetical protein